MATRPALPKDIGQGIEAPIRLSGLCGNPWCEEQAVDLHHIVRRSAIGGAFNFVEIYGTVWPNVVGLCREHHLALEDNRASIWALPGEGRYVWRQDKVSEVLDPHPPGLEDSPWPGLEEGEVPGALSSFPAHIESGVAASLSSSLGVAEGEPLAAPVAGGESGVDKSGEDLLSPSVAPGSDCPTCQRRVPIPRKKTSPKSRPFSFRVPLDAHDDLREIVDAAAEHLGCKSEPHHFYKVFLTGVTLILQEPSPERRVA